MTRGPEPRYSLEQGLRCVGRGWHPLVTRAFALFEAAGVGVVQVKEKWGGLCVYASWEDVPGTQEEQRGMFRELAAIEELSRRTCERCGAPGWLVGQIWKKTLCPVHAVRYLAGERMTDWERLDDANLC